MLLVFILALPNVTTNVHVVVDDAVMPDLRKYSHLQVNGLAFVFTKESVTILLIDIDSESDKSDSDGEAVCYML